MRPVRVSGALAATLLVSCLTGCSLSPVDIPETPKPVMPPDAMAKTPAAAESFARYWFDVNTHAAESGDTARLAAISAEQCEYCQATIHAIEEGRSEDSVWGREPLKVTETAIPEGQRVSPVVILVTFSYTADIESYSAESHGQAYPSSWGVRMALALEYTGSSWLVLAYTPTS